MSALGTRAAEVERELGADWTRYHVGAQASRFLVGMLASVLWSWHAGLGDWTDVLPLLGTAAWTSAAQVWPRVPWTLLREHLGVGAGADAGAPSVAAPQTPPVPPAAAGPKP